jgi:hypothetical protein
MAYQYNSQTKNIVKTDNPVAFPEAGKFINRISCSENQILFGFKTETHMKVYSYNFLIKQFTEVKSIQNPAASPYFYFRDSISYLAIRYPKTEEQPRGMWERYILGSELVETVAKIPAGVVNPFRYLRAFISYEDTTLENKAYTVMVEDRKKTIFEIPKRLTLNHGYNFNPAVKKLLVKDEQLYIVSKRRNSIYKYNKENKDFSELGNPLGYGVYDLTVLNNDLYIAASGNRILKFDPTNPWTYGKLDYKSLKRTDKAHNPSIIASFTDMNLANIHHISNLDGSLLMKGHLKARAGSVILNYDQVSNEVINQYSSHKDLYINFIKKTDSGLQIGTQFNKSRKLIEEGLSAKVINLDNILEKTKTIEPHLRGSNIRDYISLQDKKFYLYGNRIYQFNEESKVSALSYSLKGLRSANIIKTENDKLVFISEAKVFIFDPLSLEITELYSLEDKNITRVLSMKLFNNALFFLDQKGTVNEITLRYADLNLFDKKVVSNEL